MKNEQINQTEPTGQNQNTLALMHADMKKLIRYFKLDRHSKNNPDDAEGTVDTPDEERDKLLREIQTDIGGIKQSTDRKDFTVEQKTSLETIKGTVGKALRDFNDTKYGEIKTSIDGVKQSVDDLKTVKQESTVNHYHRHTVDDVVGRVLGTLVGLTVALLISIIVIAVQWRENGKLRDNDLKYRFIQMANGADPEMIMKLRDAFEFHRDKEIIRNVRRQVEEYEQLVKQQAETAAKARYNASEAERLRNEAETVRGGKK